MENENKIYQEKIELLKSSVVKTVKQGLWKVLKERYGYKQGKQIVVNTHNKPPKNTVAIFNDKKAMVALGSAIVKLPPAKNEHFFCRAMFRQGMGERVDWSEVYEEMTGYHKEYFGKPEPLRKHWRSVYDAMRAVNSKWNNRFGEPLFERKEKTIARLR